MEQFYEYENREEIEKSLVCGICEKPLIEPVVISTGERCCRECVEETMSEESEWHPLHDVEILQALEQLPVRCTLCHEYDLERNEYPTHLMEQCPKAIVECPGSVNHCSWLGLREELSAHLHVCSLHHSPEDFPGRFFPNGNINFQEGKIPSRDIPTAVKALLLHKRLTSLDLFNTKLSSQDASIIASVLHHDTHLNILSLRNNFLCDSGVQYLAHALVDNSHLQQLDLNENAITDTGARLLVDMLKINRTLTKLTLSFNRLTNEGLQFFIDVLIDSNSTLRWLSLAGHLGIDGLAVHGISHLIRHRQGLRILNLEDCRFTCWQKTRIYFLQKIYFRSSLEVLF